MRVSSSGRIFWALIIGFLLGVAVRSFFSFGYSYAVLLVLLALASLALILADRTRAPQGILVVVALLSCALGIARMDAATLSGDPALTAHLGQQVTLEGVVSAEPDVRDSSVRISVRVNKIVSPTRVPVAAGVLVVLPAHAEVHYGEPVRAWGQLRAPQAFDTGAGRQFNYPQYLAAQGITYELSLAQAEPLQNIPDAGNPLQSGAIWIKETFLSGVRAALPEPEAGLAGGITVGDKRSIGTQLSGVFQKVGLIHIIVLSGYNITVVLNAAVWLLKRAPILGAMRSLQYGASGFIVVLFVLMAGGAGSAARAGLMALVAVLARATARTFVASRALALAALLIVLWNPFSLAFDPSFQLSALATLGLIVFTPLFAARLQWVPEKWALREIASSTLGTQLAVLPFLLYQNGQLALYALPANLLTLAIIPTAMALSSIAALAGILLGSLAIPVALPAYVLLSYIIHVGQLFASLPFAAVSVGAFGTAWMCAAYAIIFGGAWFLHLKKKNGRAT